MQIEERELLVLKRMKEGTKLVDVAKELGVSCTRVRQIHKDAKRKFGINEPKETNSLDFVNELVEKYKQANVQDNEYFKKLKKLKYEIETLYKLKEYLMHDMKGNLFAQTVLIHDLEGAELWLKKN